MNKKEQLTESVNKMKRLFEYHFKSNGSQRDSQPTEENPVKFNEIGDKYSNHENEYPTFEEYRDEVIIDEDEPVKPEEQPAPEQPVAPAPAPAPEVQQPAPVDPAMTTQPEVPLSVDDPSMGQISQMGGENGSDLESKLNNQIAKSEEMLNAINMIQTTLANQSSGLADDRINQIAKDVEDMKTPTPEKQFDMISKNSYPYNIKLSDYWNWETEKEEAEEGKQEYTITAADVNNYDPNLIKQSLNINESLK